MERPISQTNRVQQTETDQVPYTNNCSSMTQCAAQSVHGRNFNEKLDHGRRYRHHLLSSRDRRLPVVKMVSGFEWTVRAGQCSVPTGSILGPLIRLLQTKQAQDVALGFIADSGSTEKMVFVIEAMVFVVETMVFVVETMAFASEPWSGKRGPWFQSLSPGKRRLARIAADFVPV